MQTMSDQELLAAFRDDRSEAAFAELVRRHLPWVYSVAMRHVTSAALAEDVAQTVFILLARKASGLRRETLLSGWLFRTTRFVADRAVRSERRRKAREFSSSIMMDLHTSTASDSISADAIRHLDQAVADLGQTDRAAILLRYYEKLSLRDVGARLGLSEEAAKKRVARAIDKLRGVLTRRNVPLAAAALTTLLESNAVAALPAHLVENISAQAIGSLANPGVLQPLVEETLQAIRWFKIKAASAFVSLALVTLTLVHYSTEQRSQGVAAEERMAVARLAETNSQSGTRSPILSAENSFHLQVVAASTGEPVANARIPLSYVSGGKWIQPEEGITDSAGNWNVRLPAELSRFDIGAVKDGYVQKVFTWREDSGQRRPAGRTLALEPALLIGGRVQDPLGKPIGGVAIGLSFHDAGDATFRESIGERRGFAPGVVWTTVSDPDGRWQCALAPSDGAAFSLEASHPNFVQRTFAATEEPAAGSAQLALNDLLKTNAVMVLDPALELVGRVVDERGFPVGSALVSWMRTLAYVSDGVKTSADGHFRISSLPVGVQRFAASAPGFAPSFVSLRIGPTTGNVTIQLKRGGQLDLRIVDEAGLGIPGAFAALDLPTPHNKDYSTIADAEGRVRFDGVPTNAMPELLVHAGADGYFYARHQVVDFAQTEPRVFLRKGLRVEGRVVDAETRSPIAAFKAIPCRSESRSYFDRSDTKAGVDGQYSVSFAETSSEFFVRIEAEGYEPAVSKVLRARPSEQVYDFELKKQSAADSVTNYVVGQVVKSDGAPAANISVALLTFDHPASLAAGRLVRQEGSLTGTTDERGQFKIEAPDERVHTIVAADPAGGFARLRLRQSGEPFVLRLQPWARVAGRVMLGGVPTANQEIFIQQGVMVHRSVNEGLALNQLLVKSDSNGRFFFDHLPSGDVTLYLYHGIGLPLTYGRSIALGAGEVAEVQIGGAGQRVEGALAFAGDATVNWKAQVQIGSLTRHREVPNVTPPPESDTFEGRVRLLEFFDQSKEWHAYELQSRSYPLQINGDGTFTVVDVEPGDYDLQIVVARSPVQHVAFMPRRGTPLGSLKTRITVPGEPSATVDLGTLPIVPPPVGRN